MPHIKDTLRHVTEVCAEDLTAAELDQLFRLLGKQQLAALYLRIVSFGYAAQSFYLVVTAGLNVMKRPLQAAGLAALWTVRRVLRLWQLEEV